MSNPSPVGNKAAELRDAFDRACTLPSSSGQAEQMENLLAIRLAGDPYAIRVSEITGLVQGRRIVPLPGPIPELLGIAGIRGEIVPVYSLATLLGHGPSGDAARWMVLCMSEDPVGLAFHDFESYLRVLPSDIHAAQSNGRARDHVEEVARAGHVIRSVVSIPSVIQTIKASSDKRRSSKEQ